MRKIILAGLLIFIAPDTATQPLFGMLIALVFLMLQTRHAPFLLESVDLLSFTTQTCTVLTLVFALADKTAVVDEMGWSDTTIYTVRAT